MIQYKIEPEEFIGVEKYNNIIKNILNNKDKSLRDKDFKCYHRILEKNPKFNLVTKTLKTTLVDYKIKSIKPLNYILVIDFESKEDQEKIMRFKFDKVVSFNKSEADLYDITKVDCSYFYCDAIEFSYKYNRYLFSMYFWDKFDKVYPKMSVVAEKLIVDTI